jgi:hypothetical protein
MTKLHLRIPYESMQKEETIHFLQIPKILTLRIQSFNYTAMAAVQIMFFSEKQIEIKSFQKLSKKFTKITTLE